jgi:hypothetical protein
MEHIVVSAIKTVSDLVQYRCKTHVVYGIGSDRKAVIVKRKNIYKLWSMGNT